MKSFRRFCFASLLAAAAGLFVTSASAALPEEIVPTPQKQCLLKIGSGKLGKGFANLYRDIEYVCGEEVSICKGPDTDGSFTNFNQLSNNLVDLAMGTLDIAQNLKESDSRIGNLVTIIPLNANLLHIGTKTGGFVKELTKPGEKKWGGLITGDPLVTRTMVNITKFSDLKGKIVVLVGSAKFTGQMLESQLGYGMQFVDAATDTEAINLVKAGKAHAFFTIAGWPNGEIDKLTPNSGISLVQFDLAPSPPYVLIKKNYPKMGVLNMKFMAAPSALFARPFKPTGANGKNVAKLQACILRNLDNLKEGGPDWKIQPQPGWEEVKDASTPGWPQFVPAK